MRLLGGLSGSKGFLLIDTLIAGLIITSSVAATMYLFRVGFDYLTRANQSNVISAKVSPAVNLLRSLDLKKESGTEDLGSGVLLKWQSKLLYKELPTSAGVEDKTFGPHTVYLYQVNFSIVSPQISRDYEMRLFKHTSESLAGL